MDDKATQTMAMTNSSERRENSRDENNEELCIADWQNVMFLISKLSLLFSGGACSSASIVTCDRRRDSGIALLQRALIMSRDRVATHF